MKPTLVVAVALVLGIVIGVLLHPVTVGAQAIPVFLLDLYAKNDKSDLGSEDRHQLRALVKVILKEANNVNQISTTNVL